MDFRDILQMADKNSKLAAKQSQQVKRINTNFTNPVKKEDRTASVKSDIVQRLVEERVKEKQMMKEAEERERRKIQKACQEEEWQEKMKNAFRIPKTQQKKDNASDAESFSSISSDEENTSDQKAKALFQANINSVLPKEKHKSQEPSKNHSSISPVKPSSSHSIKTSHNEGHSKSIDGSNRSSDQTSSNRNSDQTSSDKKHRSSDQHRHSAEKHKHSSDKDRHSSSHKSRHSSEKSSDRHKSDHKGSSSGRSSGLNHNSKDTSHQSQSSSSHRDSRHSNHIEEDKAAKLENDSSGYITSPDLSSADESDSDMSSQKHSGAPQRRDSNVEKESDKQPIELTRHHLKPTVDRQGCSLEERNKVLAKLQAIRERMSAGEMPDYSKKRAAKGEVKKRRAKREKLDGDFSGPCREKIEYNEEEKPSLKRPEPKPETPKPEKVKKEKVKKERPVKEKKENRDKHKKHSDAGHRHSKTDSNKSHSLHRPKHSDDAPKKSAPKIKHRHRPMPPPLNFNDLLKMAEEKQSQPVVIDKKLKKEEHRPLTQEEIDRRHQREARVKTQEYKDWYKLGEEATKASPAVAVMATDKNQEVSASGGFLRKEHRVIPDGAGPCKVGPSHSQGNISKAEKPAPSSSSDNIRPSQSMQQLPASGLPKGFRPQPNPYRPGTIANKPQAMARHFSNALKDLAPRPSSQNQPSSQAASQRPPAASSSAADKTRGGNTWDSLFNRPEYQKLKEPPAKKGRMVIDSEEEDEFDEDMDDFIDNEGTEDMDTVSGTIRQLFGYDRTKFRDEDDDDRDMEVGFSQVMKEEARSARIGRKEDLEDMRKEEEELKRKKAMKQKMRR